MNEFLYKYIIPKEDKLVHFFLWSIFLTEYLVIVKYLDKSNYYAYGFSLLTAILWEVYQKVVKKGTNSLKEILMDIFFGGILPSLLHFITTI